MKGSLTIFLLCVLYTVSSAQLRYKPVVLHNGYQNGILVRNHVEIHYTHYTPKVISGCIVVSRVNEFVNAGNTSRYSNYIQKDTLASFYGTITRGKKEGTFVSGPDGNIVTIHTYKHNNVEGPFQGYYTSGQLYNKGHLHNGQQTGDYLQYYANGKPARFITRNNIDGLSVEEYFYTNGQPESKGAMYRDKKVNEWVYYDYYGNLKKKEYYNHRGRLLKTIR
jgi:antitoxin component YwqK of YwqJK toxin-antitoxin module